MPKVLAVDDSPMLLDLVAKVLKRQGFDVTAIANGGEAVRLAETERPSIILLDLQMPDVDGFQVLTQLKQLAATAHVPVIMMTGRTEEANVRRALDLGAKDYIVKPFGTADLIKRINRALQPTAAEKRG